MTRRSIRLVLIGLAITAIVLYVGCSQPEDVLIPVSNTYVYLDELWNFPSSFDGMLYEVWAANAIDTVSLGKFGYNREFRVFYDELGAEREDSNRFYLGDDIFNYSHLFISVEKDPDIDISSPSAIMLIDYATDTDEDAIRLIFPEISDTMTLWDAIVRFNMETVADDSTYIKSGHLGTIMNTRNTTSNGFGVWFANYSRRLDSLRDTIRVIDWFIEDTVKSFDKDTTCVTKKDITDHWIDTIQRVFGLDTLQQIVMRHEAELFIDSTDPCTVYTVNWVVETVPDTADPPRYLFVDTFTQDAFNLPNFVPYGWKYKGWVVSPLIDTSWGKLNPPAWTIPHNDTLHNYYLIPGDYGGLLTTGTFAEIAQPDDSNLYAMSNRGEIFPGDEFFQNLPDGSEPLNLVPNDFDNEGSIFITLEPIDLQGPEYKNNFPLFVMISSIPTQRDSVELNQQQFTMRNWTQYSIGDRGFPLVKVNIQRF